MKDTHVTVRLPPEMARELAQYADDRALARSHIVREAVATYLRGRPATASAQVSAAELAERWPALPRLEREEAAELARDLAAARATLPAPDGWE